MTDGIRLRRVYSIEQGKWINRPETQEDKDEDIRHEISSALGGDFFADLDSAFLFPLFVDWQSAVKDEEKQKRSAFFAEFNLALDRAIKRKQIRG